MRPEAFLHPLIARWFAAAYGEPTPVQREAWPRIAEGSNVLALAPTGSGKTLAAFLVAISRFAEGAYNPEELSVLYVSPLKALNEDIRRNLLAPVAALAENFAREGSEFPRIRVATRSGDTPQAERRRFLSRPPSILAVTPESLAILLLNPRARAVLAKVRCVVIDEAHALLGSKRGVFLACQIERLALVAGEFQRIALSATVNPPEAAADFAGGLKDNGKGGHEKRKVFIVAPPIEKKITFRVEFPETTPPEIRQKREREKADSTGNTDDFGERYDVFIDFIISRIRKNRSTLVYTDSRRRAERICYLVNQTAGEVICFTHHGSLSKDLRLAAEKALAEGKIPCVVATSSLELGIDIGGLDASVVAGFPGSFNSFWQQSGRSGRRGGTSVSVFVASASPVDQFIMKDPEWFFRKSAEEARLDPDNPYILSDHVKCASFELPFRDEVLEKDEDSFGKEEAAPVLEYLEEEGIVRHVSGKWHWADRSYPAEGVSLRSAGADNVIIVDITKGRNEVIGEMDRPSAKELIFENAVYIHRGRQY
ncbi:MAG: DEAD/DEAH box helicase, partial [Spirochaetaceae bacterium]|nr:DEAD/DEAH box helicase [Spirochaetaceae bacterium]